MKDVQCYELFGGIALTNHAFFISTLVVASDFQAQHLCYFMATCDFCVARICAMNFAYR